MKSILYLEDSSMSQTLMRRYVGDAAELTICPTLAAAPVLLSQKKWDLLITDFLFPDGNCLDLITRLRVQRTPQELPIIVVSGSMDRVLLTRVLGAGANDGFSKPIRMPEFQEVLLRMLTEPYVKSVDHGLVEVRCFQWQVADTHHQFCPDLGLTVAAPTREKAAEEMLSLLRARAREGRWESRTRHHGTVSHIVET